MLANSRCFVLRGVILATIALAAVRCTQGDTAGTGAVGDGSGGLTDTGWEPDDSTTVGDEGPLGGDDGPGTEDGGGAEPDGNSGTGDTAWTDAAPADAADAVVPDVAADVTDDVEEDSADGIEEFPDADGGATDAGDVGCAPSCAGKECGPDGCGGTCGQCPIAAPVCEAGLCTVACTPACAGKECGPDGCGGACGQCPVAAPVCEAGLCTVACTPACAGKECGPDGCGGTCGQCPVAAPVCEAGLCTVACTPACAGKECGPDGCEGTCGACPAAAPVCDGGVCTTAGMCSAAVACLSTCSPGNAGCIAACKTPLGPGALAALDEYAACHLLHCASVPDAEVGLCIATKCFASYQACIVGTSGTASCEEIVTCAATCTTAACRHACEAEGTLAAQEAWVGGVTCIDAYCPDGEAACESAVQQPNGACHGFVDQCLTGGTCVPACTAKECGPDGCGGSCGGCEGVCVAGVCAPHPPDCFDLVGCIATCNDNLQCAQACYGAAPAPAQADYLALSQCANASCAAAQNFQECLTSACFTQLHACLIGSTGDGTCEDGQTCIQACLPEDTECQYSCLGTVTPGASQAWLGLQACVAGVCPGGHPGCVSEALVGACSAAYVSCIPTACVPSCMGKQCGDDGCGGSCGACVPGASCLSGTCVTSGPCVASTNQIAALGPSLYSITASCAFQGCFSAGSFNEPCIAACLSTKAFIPTDCGLCFAAVPSCALASQCLACGGTLTQACINCLDANGCITGFEACSGISSFPVFGGSGG